jgi:hypothetical protein
VRQSPRCVEDHVKHEVAGRQPQSESGERYEGDSSATMSVSKSARDAAPQQEEGDSGRNAGKEQDEKCTLFQEALLMKSASDVSGFAPCREPGQAAGMTSWRSIIK